MKINTVVAANIDLIVAEETKKTRKQKSTNSVLFQTKNYRNPLRTPREKAD